MDNSLRHKLRTAQSVSELFGLTELLNSSAYSAMSVGNRAKCERAIVARSEELKKITGEHSDGGSIVSDERGYEVAGGVASEVSGNVNVRE